LAIFDEGFVEPGVRLDPSQTPALDAKTAALLQVGVSVTIGSSAVCLQWSTGRALAAGATNGEITGELLAIRPLRMTGAHLRVVRSRGHRVVPSWSPERMRIKHCLVSGLT